MTNEEAIDLVGKYVLTDEGHDETARVFLCEDIIEMGIDKWVEEDVKVLMLDFVKYIDEGAERAISSPPDGQDPMGCAVKLKERMIDTFESLSTYASVHAKISDDYLTGLWMR